jgi:hypothetical protein
VGQLSAARGLAGLRDCLRVLSLPGTLPPFFRYSAGTGACSLGAVVEAGFLAASGVRPLAGAAAPEQLLRVPMRFGQNQEPDFSFL